MLDMTTRRRISLLCCLLAAGAASTAALGQTADSLADNVRRLSPEEKERILAESSEAAADASLRSIMGGGGSGTSSQIHGEVGAMIGTGNTYGVFGTALVPLGENGSAIFSFSKSQFGDLRAPRR